jgi:hypothetical protein
MQTRLKILDFGHFIGKFNRLNWTFFFENWTRIFFEIILSNYLYIFIKHAQKILNCHLKPQGFWSNTFDPT